MRLIAEGTRLAELTSVSVHSTLRVYLNRNAPEYVAYLAGFGYVATYDIQVLSIELQPGSVNIPIDEGDVTGWQLFQEQPSTAWLWAAVAVLGGLALWRRGRR